MLFALLVALLVALWWRAKQSQLAGSLSLGLERAEKALIAAETTRNAALAALENLREEAPRAVWEDLEMRRRLSK